MSRVLTVKQPWADLIMAEIKDVENRTWPVPSTLPQRWRCLVCRSEWRSGYRGSSIDPANGCPNRCSRMKDPDLLGPFPFRLGIHAAASNAPAPAWAWAEHERLPHGRDEVRRGVLLGFVTVTGCHHADDCDKVDGDLVTAWPSSSSRGPQFCSRWAEPDAYHWQLADPEPFVRPVPMKGMLGLWTLPEPANA